MFRGFEDLRSLGLLESFIMMAPLLRPWVSPAKMKKEKPQSKDRNLESGAGVNANNTDQQRTLQSRTGIAKESSAVLSILPSGERCR